MILHRTTGDPTDRNSANIFVKSDDFTFDTWGFDEPPESRDVVRVRFPRFGSGEKNQSNLEVLADWKVVQRMIDIFCENGQPEAIAIRDAIRLAAAARRAGWQPSKPEPQSN